MESSARTLPPPTLDRGITFLGSTRGLHTLFSQLTSGGPITMAVFGASIAQNAGCLDQPGKRCMWYSGLRNVSMSHGRPRKRPFKGFAVRLYDHIQARFPHPAHQINNSAIDATPLQLMLPCLFSYTPPRIHLVLLDFGSMATHLEFSAIEGVVRSLLSLRPPPTLLLISFQEWCSQRLSPRSLYRVGQLMGGQRMRGNIYPDTPWSRAEIETERVCQHYGHACISVHRALAPHVYSNETGFGLLDIVGKDCLHPLNSIFGVDYVTQLLTHWFDLAHATWRQIKQSTPNSVRRIRLPPPLDAATLNTRHMRCLGFKPLGDQTSQLLSPVLWCSPDSRGRGRAQGFTCAGEVQKTCPRRALRSSEALQAYLAKPPRYWFYCRFALSSASRKISPGVRSCHSNPSPHRIL